jgi:putative (di)nucleoside polyphosphate hydrolase
VDFWYPIEHVVNFKRGVYVNALHQLAPFARQVAGAQAIPPPNVESRRWSRPRGRRRPAGGRTGPSLEPVVGTTGESDQG